MGVVTEAPVLVLVPEIVDAVPFVLALRLRPCVGVGVYARGVSMSGGDARSNEVVLRWSSDEVEWIRRTPGRKSSPPAQQNCSIKLE